MGNTQEGNELDLIAALYDAAAEPQLWPSLLDRIVAMTSSSTAILSLSDPQADVYEVEVSGLDPDLMRRDYAEYYAAIDPALPVMTLARVGTFNYLHDKVDLAEIERSEFYQDFGRHVHRHDSAILLTDDFQTNFSGLCLTRTRQAGMLQPEDLALVESVADHFCRAVRLGAQIRHAQQRSESLLAVLDGFTTAVFLLDKEGQIIDHNRRAESLLREGSALRRSGRKLLAASHPAQALLDRAVRESAETSEGRRGSAGSWVGIPRGNHAPPFAAFVGPIRSSGARVAPLHARVIVYVNVPEERPPCWESVAQATWGLTPTEARISALLAQGLDVNAIAERLLVLPDTVRTHLKRCFSKVDVNQQSQLVAALWRTAGPLVLEGAD